MPLMPLYEATGSVRKSESGDSAVYAVVVQAGNGEDDHPVAIGVDALIDQHEIVVKSLSNYLGRTRGISGATIMGDGQVVLIVDVPTLIKRSLQREAEVPALERSAEWVA